MHDFLLYAHLIGVFLIVGSAGVSKTLGIRATKVEDVKTLKWIADVMTFNDRVVASAGLLITVVFGALLVDESGHEMSESWVSAAFLLSFVAIGLIHGVLVKGSKQKSARCAELLAEGTNTTTEFQGSDLSKKMAMTGMVTTALLLILLWLMVAQPGS